MDASCSASFQAFNNRHFPVALKRFFFRPIQTRIQQEGRLSFNRQPIAELRRSFWCLGLNPNVQGPIGIEGEGISVTQCKSLQRVVDQKFMG